MDYDALISSLEDDAPAPEGDTSRCVIGWVSAASTKSEDLMDIGGWGGFIQPIHRWGDYVSGMIDEFVPYFEALRKDIIARGLRRGGDWHQNAPDGVPVFDDGAIGFFSLRGWGDLMAATWSEEDGRGYSSMDFYMDSCIERAGLTLSPPRDPA